jgi:hypothetical protein
MMMSDDAAFSRINQQLRIGHRGGLVCAGHGEFETECVAVRCLDCGARQIIGCAVQTPEKYPMGRHCIPHCHRWRSRSRSDFRRKRLHRLGEVEI